MRKHKKRTLRFNTLSKRNSVAMLLVITSCVIGIFIDTNIFLKVLSGIIAGLAFAVLFNWLPIKKNK